LRLEAPGGLTYAWQRAVEQGDWREGGAASVLQMRRRPVAEAGSKPPPPLFVSDN
jgi:hypothetical protein